MSIRTEKVASAVMKALAMSVRSIAKEFKAGLVSITAVKMTNDLKLAKVYVSTYGGECTPAHLIEALENNKPAMKSIVASNLRLRFTPDLRFFIDDTFDKIEHIEKLLSSADEPEKKKLF